MKTLSANILDNFPNIELFYNLSYKKVSNYNLILAIPQGNKSFIWFTKINGKNMIVLINIDNINTDNINIDNINTDNINTDNINTNNYNFLNLYSFNNSFNYELLGTIMYGTSFKIENKLYFSIEDLFYHKKINVSNETFLNKLNIINQILNNDIYKINNFDNSIIIGIPPMHTTYLGLNNIIKQLPYKINELKYILTNENHVYVHYKKYIIKQELKTKIFKVVPQERTDIYNLYLFNQTTKQYDFDSIAFIPDYKTSIIMNKIFHGLKDYDNLDYLEESDDEFEITDNLENNWKLMECTFNNKFKKWVPTKVIE